jgi:CxxC motif-containing protein (DUF1111 family)
MKKTYSAICILAATILLLQACSKMFPVAPAEDEVLDGLVEGLTYEQNIQFLTGDAAFNNDIFSPERGLGPVFVATSCGVCHPGDGKGHPMNTFIRFGQSDTTGNTFLDRGGPQLQDRAIPGYQPEKLPADATFSKMTAPANTGLGFIDAIPDATLLSLADPYDLDGDGVSGVPNWIYIPSYSEPRVSSIVRSDGKYIGRFGKKASTYDLLQQTVTAYNQDMGITSSFEPFDVYSGEIVESEVDDNTVLNIVFYLKTLKAPIQRTPGDPDVVDGKRVFSDIGCAKCHVTQITTGFSPIPALSYKVISPYTDLLLHDMGAELDDNYTEGSALTYEWRTPPLWGLGLSKNSQGGQYFLLHDGRAGSIDEAIKYHGGEADMAGSAYQSLSQSEKDKLIKFLESL